jgi:hypothetical protein
MYGEGRAESNIAASIRPRTWRSLVTQAWGHDTSSAVNEFRRLCSMLLFSSGLGNSPVWVCSDLVCLITPGEVWREPTKVCGLLGVRRSGKVLGRTMQVTIVLSGKALWKGYLLPTPFWMITIVVLFTSTTGTSCAGTELWPMALCAHTT